MTGKPFPFNVPVGSRYGAPMGRSDLGPTPDDYTPVRLRRVPLDQGYDAGGAYWGDRPRGLSLFCAWAADRSYIRYVEAPSYLIAQAVLREDFPQADFL